MHQLEELALTLVAKVAAMAHRSEDKEDHMVGQLEHNKEEDTVPQSVAKGAAMEHQLAAKEAVMADQLVEPVNKVAAGEQVLEQEVLVKGDTEPVDNRVVVGELEELRELELEDKVDHGVQANKELKVMVAHLVSKVDHGALLGKAESVAKEELVVREPHTVEATVHLELAESEVKAVLELMSAAKVDLTAVHMAQALTQGDHQARVDSAWA